jgi:hypothetical protein
MRPPSTRSVRERRSLPLDGRGTPGYGDKRVAVPASLRDLKNLFPAAFGIATKIQWVP